MPTTTISLTRASLIWKPRHRTRLRGYGVISAVAYDGARGILPTNPLAPIPFERRPRRGFDFIRPNSAGVGDDGVLIKMFADIPRAVGWAVMLTLTHDLEHGQQVTAAAQKAAGSAFRVNEGTGVLKAVYAAAGAIAEAIDSILGARIVGTWVSSESDAADLRRDWRISHENFKARFELDYDVQTIGDEGDDD